MKRSSLASFFGSSVAASLALVVASTSASCSDSGSSGSGGGASGPAPDATVGAPTDAQGADVAVDSAADAASSGDADAASAADADAGARVCALPASDAGARALTLSWTATAPVLIGAATIVGQIVQPDCTVVLATGTTAAGPPAYTVYLEKKDTAAGSCATPKGFRYLYATTFAMPAAFLAHHPSDPMLFVVAYDHKNTQSGSSPVQLSMQQVDWDSGDMLHGAGFSVVGTMQNIPPAGSPTALTVSGCDVVLDGSGTFPGASGAATTAWTATYTHFLAPTPQDASSADLAAYK